MIIKNIYIKIFVYVNVDYNKYIYSTSSTK